jgi:hypothetical protein
MKGILYTAALVLLFATLVSCGASKSDDTGNMPAPGSNEKGGEEMQNNINDRVSMHAIIRAIDERLEVEVTSSEYTSGIHWVITHDSTAYYAADGSAITRADLQVGDEVEILYNGQVMLSYPPQIVAHRITVL